MKKLPLNLTLKTGEIINCNAMRNGGDFYKQSIIDAFNNDLKSKSKYPLFICTVDINLSFEERKKFFRNIPLIEIENLEYA